MVKPTKFLRKQAEKAEAAALRASDSETSEGLLALARAYRSQAEVLKQKKKTARKTSRARQ